MWKSVMVWRSVMVCECACCVGECVGVDDGVGVMVWMSVVVRVCVMWVVVV